MVDERLSKKPRTQSNAANADANARATIARANSHVQQLFPRQHRWSAGGAVESGESAPVLRDMTANAPAGLGSSIQDQGQGQRSAPGQRNYTQSVGYESPATLESASLTQATHDASGRSFSDNASATARTLPSLPSPAPSDENTNSPIIAEGQLCQLGSRRGCGTGTSRGRTPAEGVALHISALSTPASASPLSTQSPTIPFHTHQQFTQMGVPQTNLGSGAQGQPRERRQSRQQSQQQIHRQPQFQQQATWQGPRPGGHSRTNSIKFLSNLSGTTAPPVPSPTIVQSNNHRHPMPTQMYAPASRTYGQDLLAEVSQREQQLSQARRLTPTNNGRLLLLKDAVEKGDWFYLILSQMFCLRSIAPDTLPQSMSEVGQKCFDMLDALLCSNRDVDPELLHFFSRFPEPIMNIYSNAAGDARDQYEARLRMVKDFLIRLPMHWDGLVHRCQALQSPPLVQDMIETLGLQSVILQTTAFRAIARMFWGLGENKGIRALEQLHHIDQETYYRQSWRRNQAEKNACYRNYHYTLQKWSEAAGEQQANFTAPTEVLHYFKQVPQSTLFAFQQQQQQKQQHQLQQRQQTQAPPNIGPLSPTLQNQNRQQHQMQMQMQMQMQAQAQGQGAQLSPTQHGTHNNISHMSMAPPVHQVTSAGLRHQAPPFFPRAEGQPRAQPTHPDPTRSALHQAHLRSPILGPTIPEPNAPTFYRHVVGYGMPPTKLRRAAAVQYVTFTVSEATLMRLAKNEPPLNTGEPPRRTMTEESLNFRLRCCTCPPNGIATESSWVIADNYWPDDLYFRLNDYELETRRKLHHGRYLPVDLTDFIREGTNALQITTNRLDRDTRKTNFAVAVEAVGIVTHDAIKNNLKRISAADSLASIKKSLMGEDCGDDDIAVTSSSMTIKLTDPYSGCNMVNIPVRGSECLHHDCFDLDVYLDMCRRPHEGWPTIVDCWRCPLCRGDVRPQMLIVDEFLLEVRETLAKQNLSDARAIVVETDGSWQVKKEERKGVRSASLEREERRKPSLIAPVAAPKKTIEVIELPDD